MDDDEHEPVVEDTTGGGHVFWEPRHYSPEDIEAQLPDGTRIPSVLQLDGRRLGFDQELPAGTWLLLRGKPTWQVPGASPTV